MDIVQLPDESDTVYNFRKQFIEKIKDKYDLHHVVMYSKIAANIKFKHIKYDSSIYNMLKQYI